MAEPVKAEGVNPSEILSESKLASMDAETLRRYLQFLLWHYKVADGFWFIYATEAFGQGAAEKLNEQVWAKAGGMAAKDLIRRFDLRQGGIPGFIQVLRLYPWSLLIGYHIEQRADEMILTVPSCPSQQARLQRGLGEYSCKAMHQAEFESLARAVDERLRVACLFAPPDPHPADCFCRWRFWLDSAARS